MLPVQGEAVVQQKLAVDGKEWLMTCVSMGNPHAITFGLADGSSIKVKKWPSPAAAAAGLCSFPLLLSSL